MDRAKISVIVPVYNVEAYLARCVDSILAQTYEHLEIILVDDGSRDASGIICDSYAQKDSRVAVLHKENGGLSSARNAGIDAASGEYLAFVDSDDWIERRAYEWMMELMLRQDVKLVCAGRYDVDGGTGEKTVGLCPQKEEVISGEEMAGRIFTWDHCDSSACDKLYHRSLFETHRYPLGVVCEDLPVTYRIALEAGRVAMCPKPVYNYYHRAGSISLSSVSDKTFHYSRHTARIEPYIREHHPAIAEQARFLRVRSLYHLCIVLEQAEKPIRQQYAPQRRQTRRELAKHLSFIFQCSRIGKQEKITDFLLVLGIYALLRPLFHRG